MALIFLQPVGDLFQLYRLAAHLDFLFHRDDVHADAVAAGTNHRGDVFQGQEGHTLEHPGNGGILCDPILGGVEQLRAAGHEVGGAVAELLRRAGDRAVVVVVVAVVVFHEAVDAEVVQRLFKGFLAHLLIHGKQLVVGVPLALLHGQGDVHLVLAEDLAQTPVFLVGGLQTEELMRDVVGDPCAELRVLFLFFRFSVVFRFGRRILVINFRHGESPFSVGGATLPRHPCLLRFWRRGGRRLFRDSACAPVPCIVPRQSRTREGRRFLR